MFSQDEYRGKFALPRWWIVSLQTPLHSSITHRVLLYTPPPPWFSSAIIGAAQSPSALLCLDWRFDISFSASYCISVSAPPLDWALLNPLLDLDQEHLYFSPESSPPSLSVMLSIDGLLRWIGAPWPGFAPHNFIPHSSITIISPHAHPALHIRHSSCPGGALVFPTNSSYCLSNSILIHRELTSQFQPFRYHKSSQTALELYFAHSPGPNYSEISGTPPSSFHRWWIVWSCVHRPWWDGRFSGWHCDHGRLISFDRFATVLFLVYLLSFLNRLPFSLVLLNVAMQTVECWMRCWVL